MKLSNGLGSLTLVCRKCTGASKFAAPTLEVAVELAKLKGWVAEGSNYVCPTCPAHREPAVTLASGGDCGGRLLMGQRFEFDPPEAA